MKHEPTEYIDRIFKRLGATYGAAWDRALGQTPIADIKTVWLHDLSGFLQSREAMKSIAWALDNLPDHCPNVRQFVHLCQQAPHVELPRLPEPAADPVKVKAVLQEIGKITKPTGYNPKGWAHNIIARHQSGEKVAAATLKMARDALV